jgi:dolichol kinase
MKNFIFIFVLFSFILVLGEVIKVKLRFSSEVTRRLGHIFAGIIASFLPTLTNLQTAVILGVIFTFVMFISKKKMILSSIHGVERETVGAVLFPLALTICAVLYWDTQKIFAITCLILGLSDVFANIVGNKFGKLKYNITGLKTLEGSGAFVLSTFIILLFFGIPLPTALILSITFSLIEGASGGGWDNLTVPTTAGLFLKWFT